MGHIRWNNIYVYDLENNHQNYQHYKVKSDGIFICINLNLIFKLNCRQLVVFIYIFILYFI